MRRREKGVRKVVVLAGGGWISAVALALAKDKNLNVTTVTVLHDDWPRPRVVQVKEVCKYLLLPAPHVVPMGVSFPSGPCRQAWYLQVALAIAHRVEAGSVLAARCSIPLMGRIEAVEAEVWGKDSVPVNDPLGGLSDVEAVSLGQRLGVPWQLTCDCEQADPDGEACGECPSCLTRKLLLQKVLGKDVTRYQTW